MVQHLDYCKESKLEELCTRFAFTADDIKFAYCYQSNKSIQQGAKPAKETLVVRHCVFNSCTRRPTAGATRDPVIEVCVLDFKRELCGHPCCVGTVPVATPVCEGREGDRAPGRGFSLQALARRGEERRRLRPPPPPLQVRRYNSECQRRLGGRRTST